MAKNNLERVLTVDAEAENEWIAGVARTKLFNGKYWTGFENVSEDEMFDLVAKHLEFRPRTDDLERDESFKQIIPYFLVKKGEEYFTSVRKTQGGDSRAHGKRLIGFGGHLRAEDVKDKQMKDWLLREFDEEIDTQEIKDISFLGIVNDDSDATGGIGKVHFGLVFVIKVEGLVFLKEQNKFEVGEFMSVEKLKDKSGEMESWSEIVTNNL